jgi:hypothetical protein
MKRAVLTIVLLLPILAFASKFSYSDIPQKEGKPYYAFTVAVPGVEKNELFHRAQLFLAEYFKKSEPQ